VSGEGVHISHRGWWFSGVPQGNSGVWSGSNVGSQGWYRS
jgi:hypothetical protein